MIEKEFLKKIKAIEINSRKMAQDGLLGDYKSAFRGTGMQFKEFRKYVYGDDVRHIAWNVSARQSEPVIKLYEEERERSLYLLVDVSDSFRRGHWAQQKASRLAEIAGTLAVSANMANDHLGLLLFSDIVEKFIPEAKGRSHLLRIIRDVLLFEPKNSRSSTTKALQKLEPFLKKKSIVIILSDMESLPDTKICRRISSRHELMAINIDHPGEWKMPKFFGFMEIQGAESRSNSYLDTSSNKTLELLSENFSLRQKKIREHFKKIGANYFYNDCQSDFLIPLKNFLKGKRK